MQSSAMTRPALLVVVLFWLGAIQLGTADTVLPDDRTTFHDGENNIFSSVIMSSGKMRSKPAATPDGSHIFVSISLDQNITDTNGTACYETSTFAVDYFSSPPGGCNGGSFSPMLDNGEVYQGCLVDPTLPTPGGFYKLDPSTGQVLWKWMRPDILDSFNISTATRVHAFTDKIVIVTSGPYYQPACKGGMTVGVNRMTGQTVWTIPNAWAIASGVRDGDMLYMPFQCGDVVGFKAATGEPLWSRSWTARLPATIISSQVVVQDGLLYIGARGALRVVNATTGADVWTYYLPVVADSIDAGPIVVPVSAEEQPLVVFGSGSQLWAIQALPEVKTFTNKTVVTGTWYPFLRWTFERTCDKQDLGTPCFTSPAAFIEANALFVGTWDGLLLQIDLFSGSVSTYGSYNAGGEYDAINGVMISDDRTSMLFTAGRKVYKNKVPTPTPAAPVPNEADSWDVSAYLKLEGIDDVKDFQPNAEAYLKLIQQSLQDAAPNYILVTLTSYIDTALNTPVDGPGAPPAPGGFIAIPSPAAPTSRRRLSQLDYIPGGTWLMVRTSITSADAAQLTVSDCQELVQKWQVDASSAIMAALEKAGADQRVPASVAFSIQHPASGFADKVLAGSKPIDIDSSHGSRRRRLKPLIIFAIAAAGAVALCLVIAAVLLCRRRWQRQEADVHDAIGGGDSTMMDAAKAEQVRSRGEAIQKAKSNGTDSVHSSVSVVSKGGSPHEAVLQSMATKDTMTSEHKLPATMLSLMHSSDFQSSNCTTASSEAADERPVPLLRDIAARAGNLPQVSQRISLASAMVTQKIDNILQARQGVLMNKYLLQFGPEQQRVSHQAVVHFAEGMYSGTHAIKFFCNSAVFENEYRIKKLPPLKGFFADVLDMGQGEPGLPPYRVSLKGQPLSDWLKPNRKCSLLEAMRVLGQVSLRLEMLHASGFVHRNVKPSQIIWMPDSNTWTLTDFGHAYEMGDEVPLDLMSIELRNAPPELALQSAKGMRRYPVSAATDSWALGLLGFRLMTGRDLFPADMKADAILAVFEGRKPLPWEEDSAEWDKEAKLLGELRNSILHLLERNPLKRERVTCVRREWMGTLKAALAQRTT